MEGWLVDTSAVARWTQPAVAQILNVMLNLGRVWTCPMIDLEVLFSAKSPREYRTNAADRAVVFRPAPMDQAVADRALRLQSALARRSQHRGVGPADLLIAATAVEHDLVVLHYDRGFELLGTLCAVPQQPIVPLGSID
jgi:predicted nucleic acid-binding protein